MAIAYKINVLQALKDKGYNSNVMRQQRLMGQSAIQQLRHNELVSWANINTICKLLECQPGDLLQYMP